MGHLPAWYGRLIKFCRGRGRSREDARDLVQEACLRLIAYQRSTEVRDEDSLLRRIVLNLDITQWHREHRTIVLARRSVDAIDRRIGLPDGRPGPDRILAAQQELHSVADALNGVSRRTAWIFIAQRAGYSYEELAQACGVAERTIEKHVARAAEIVQMFRRP